MTLVGAAWLSELRFVAGHVEDVVDDLENDAELCREAPKRHCRRSVESLEREHRSDRGCDQRARLQLVEAAEVRLLGAGDVEELAADHSVRAGGGHALAKGGYPVAGLAPLPGAGEPQRPGEQAVARENRYV